MQSSDCDKWATEQWDDDEHHTDRWGNSIILPNNKRLLYKSGLEFVDICIIK